MNSNYNNYYGNIYRIIAQGNKEELVGLANYFNQHDAVDFMTIYVYCAVARLQCCADNKHYLI